jgi:hypothetical protein
LSGGFLEEGLDVFEVLEAVFEVFLADEGSVFVFEVEAPAFFAEGEVALGEPVCLTQGRGRGTQGRKG